MAGSSSYLLVKHLCTVDAALVLVTGHWVTASAPHTLYPEKNAGVVVRMQLTADPVVPKGAHPPSLSLPLSRISSRGTPANQPAMVAAAASEQHTHTPPASSGAFLAAKHLQPRFPPACHYDAVLCASGIEALVRKCSRFRTLRQDSKGYVSVRADICLVSLARSGAASIPSTFSYA